MALMAGQNVGMVTQEQPTQQIITELIQQANEFLAAY